MPPAGGPTAPARIAPWAYGYWALVGACAAVGVLALLTVGIVAVLLAGLLVVAGLLVPGLRTRAWRGAIGGVALAPLLLAWTNRGGPGEVCRTIGDGTACTDEWSPWPFLVVALALLAWCALLISRGPRSN